MVVGDTHGNTKFVSRYIYPMAHELQVDRIVQVGDFGYWEHEPAGVAFLDEVETCALFYDIPLYWLRGNHDKVSLCLERYGRNLDDEGFIICRPGVLHIHDGHTWTWAGRLFRAFGGAYSIDKKWRLEVEARRNRQEAARAEGRRQAGAPEQPLRDHTASVWFPEEELTDAEFTALLLADLRKVDIMLSHDKPAGADPGVRFKDEPECLRNQQWLQRAAVQHRPDLWLHGHLHHPYTSGFRTGDNDAFTTVIGLGCDWDAASRFVRPADAWCLLDLDEQIVVTRGRDAQVPLPDLDPR